MLKKRDWDLVDEVNTADEDRPAAHGKWTRIRLARITERDEHCDT